ncbi:MAG TPA: inositol monophosphatase family protein [Gemmatimonadaceae bacterium]|nr:inositol monophosphatase family protein [Gemmatimonadaceae bacterium]
MARATPATPPPRADQRALLATAVAAAARAADVIRRRPGDPAAFAVREKSPADWVSAVDLAAEDAIREVIAARHPDAALVAEERSPDAAVGSLVFVVDPLDGTTNFLHGYPVYAVSIAAVVDGGLAAGVVLDVPTGELFTATAGGGARMAGQPIRVSATTDPRHALVGTGFPFKHPDLLAPYLAQLPRVLASTSGVRRAGSAALDLAAVAAGRFDAFWELRLAAWDVAAGILLVREAGGIVTDLDGRDAAVSDGPVVAGNPAMHAWLLRELSAAATS